MKVLVTGASGLIGAATVRALLAEGVDVVAAGRGPANHVTVDLTTPDGASKLVEDVQPDRVVHLAWSDENRIHNLDAFDWVGHTASLLRACVEHGVEHIVTAGTCFEYELGSSDNLTAGLSPEHPVTVYGAAKLAVRDLVMGLTAAGALGGAHARIFYVYGQGERSPRLVPTVGLALLRNEEVATTDGSQRRDFLNVDDVGDALALLSLRGETGTYDIASGTSIPVGRLIDGLESRITSGHVNRGALSLRDGDPDVVVGDPTAMAALGWQPKIDLNKGLDQVVDWLRHLHEQELNV